MSRSRMRSIAAIVLLLLHAGIAFADEKKPAVVLPKDGKTVVLTYDPGAGGFKRTGEAPFLKITADGSVTVTDLHSGVKKEAKLTPKELEELMAFVVTTNDIFALTDEKLKDAVATAAANGPFIAVGGAGTSVITVEANEKKHTVSFRAAETYAKQYPTVKLLPQFVAVEIRLRDYAISVQKAKDK